MVKKLQQINGKIPAKLVKKRFNYAKVGFDESGDVEYVSAYNLNQFLVVDKVEGNEVVGIEGDGLEVHSTLKMLQSLKTVK